MDEDGMRHAALTHALHWADSNHGSATPDEIVDAATKFADFMRGN